MAKYQRPVCILTADFYDNEQVLPWDPPSSSIIYQGSARGCSIVGVNNFKTICAETGVCEYCTGHQNAFGLGIKKENIQSFIAKTDAALINMNDQAIYYVDYIYNNKDVSPQNLLQIASLEQLWGQDVSEPLLCIQNLIVSSDMITVYTKKDNTLKITLPNYVSLIKFRATDEECQKLQNNPFGSYTLNVIGKASRNEWNGNVSAQLIIQDYEIIDSNLYVF